MHSVSIVTCIILEGTHEYGEIVYLCQVILKISGLT